MMTDCGSNLRCGWFLFCFCSTILVCVSVVSILGFDAIWPWRNSAIFLSALSFSLPKSANEVDGAGFSAL